MQKKLLKRLSLAYRWIFDYRGIRANGAASSSSTFHTKRCRARAKRFRALKLALAADLAARHNARQQRGQRLFRLDSQHRCDGDRERQRFVGRLLSIEHFHLARFAVTWLFSAIFKSSCAIRIKVCWRFCCRLDHIGAAMNVKVTRSHNQ